MWQHAVFCWGRDDSKNPKDPNFPIAPQPRIYLTRGLEGESGWADPSCGASLLGGPWEALVASRLI